jgi:hypothetical protein
MPHIYIHSQSLLQGSATMMFDTATVILDTEATCGPVYPVGVDAPWGDTCTP